MQNLPLALQPPDPSVRIRPVRLEDAGTLHAQCWPDRPHTAVFQLVIRAQRSAEQGRGLGVVLVADEPNLIKGYGQLVLWPRCGEISDLVVAQKFRGQGLGTAIIQYLVRAAREMRADCVEIGAALSNTGAVTLYRRLGFEDHHTTVLNIGNGNEPVLFLRLTFPGRTNDEDGA